VIFETEAQIKEGPKEGVYVQGLFVEGARWNFDDNTLAEPEPMQLFSTMPIVHFKPVEAQKNKSFRGIYRCPMYLYPHRTGSRERPSYMGMVELASGMQSPEFWTKRGTAVLLALAN